MPWKLPLAAQTWSAIETYLQLAYTTVPLSVRMRLDTLRAASDADFYRGAAFEHSPAHDPQRYCLRLGNRFYPHMKLVIERCPNETHGLFRADTHDRHVQPAPDHPEAAAFAELASKNQQLATAIEAAWDANSLPTFKRFLREDLARRKRELANAMGTSPT